MLLWGRLVGGQAEGLDPLLSLCVANTQHPPMSIKTFDQRMLPGSFPRSRVSFAPKAPAPIDMATILPRRLPRPVASGPAKQPVLIPMYATHAEAVAAAIARRAKLAKPGQLAASAQPHAASARQPATVARAIARQPTAIARQPTVIARQPTAIARQPVVNARASGHPTLAAARAAAGAASRAQPVVSRVQPTASKKAASAAAVVTAPVETAVTEAATPTEVTCPVCQTTFAPNASGVSPTEALANAQTEIGEAIPDSVNL